MSLLTIQFEVSAEKGLINCILIVLTGEPIQLAILITRNNATSIVGATTGVNA